MDSSSFLADWCSLLKRRQIRNSQPCAIATAHLLRRVVGASRVTDVAKLIERVQQVGQRLVAAQPKELAVGNVVRRVLGVIRDEAEEDREGEPGLYSDAGDGSRPGASGPKQKDVSGLGRVGGSGVLPTGAHNERPSLLTSHASYIAGANVPSATSLFSLLSHPPSKVPSPSGTPGPQSRGHSPSTVPTKSIFQDPQDLRAEVVEGIQEIIEELNQADDQIASYALDHIHSNEIVLTHTPSMTVQKFLLKAAAKRKFTVVHAETSSTVHHQVLPVTKSRSTGGNDDEASSERFQKALTAAGVTMVVVPFSAIFALMSRVNKVLLGTHVVLADGGLVAAAGAQAITKAARMHRTPVVVLSGVYKLSPIYPFDTEALTEFGDPSQVNAFGDGDLIGKVGVENPLFDFIPQDLVDLYITNLFVPFPLQNPPKPSILNF